MCSQNEMDKKIIIISTVGSVVIFVMIVGMYYGL